MDRRRPPPSRQKRGVDVQATQPWRIQHRLRQDQAVSHHHRHIRLKRRKGLLICGVAQPQRRANVDSQLFGSPMNRREARLLPPPGCAGRLRIDSHDLVPRSNRPQRRHRKLGRSHENHPHRQPFQLGVKYPGGPGAGPRSFTAAPAWPISRPASCAAGATGDRHTSARPDGRSGAARLLPTGPRSRDPRPRPPHSGTGPSPHAGG